MTRPSHVKRKLLIKTLIVTTILMTCVVILSLFFQGTSSAPSPRPAESSTDTKQNQQTLTTPTQTFNRPAFSLDDPTSPWVVVNKQRPLQPKTYTPTDLRIPNVAKRPNATSDEVRLRDAAATALEQMFTAAKEQGINLIMASGYRSYNLQVGVYNRNVSQVGQAEADIRSARPGHSEHQTGLAADVGAASRKCEIEDCFADTAEGKWVAAQANTFGFVIRYPKSQQAATGYVYEPWHIRYVGLELATELQKSNNPTLEAFFDLPNAPSY